MKTILLTLSMFAALALSAQEPPERGPRRDRTCPPPTAPGTETKKDESRKEDAKKEEAKPPVATVPDASRKPVLTTNTLSVAGKTVRYVSETGMLPLLKTDGTARASVFYIAYTVEGGTNPRHGRSRSLSTEDLARLRSGCISARSARGG